MSNLVTLQLKLPRNTDITPESAKTFLSALTSISSVSPIQKLFGVKPQRLSLEIVSQNQQILFLITCEEDIAPFVQTQLQSNYPLVIISKIDDPLQGKELFVKNFKLTKGSFYPISTYEKFTDIDPLASILSVLSKSETDETTILQIALEATGSNWQAQGMGYADFGTKNEDGTYSPRSDKNIIVEKISYPGFACSIRVASTTNKTLNEISSALGVFTRSDGNSITGKKIGLFKKSKVIPELIERTVSGKDILNILELATLWHLLSDKIKVGKSSREQK